MTKNYARTKECSVCQQEKTTREWIRVGNNKWSCKPCIPSLIESLKDVAKTYKLEAMEAKLIADEASFLEKEVERLNEKVSEYKIAQKYCRCGE